MDKLLFPARFSGLAKCGALARSFFLHIGEMKFLKKIVFIETNATQLRLSNRAVSPDRGTSARGVLLQAVSFDNLE